MSVINIVNVAVLLMLLWSESEIPPPPFYLNIRNGNKKSWEINVAFENRFTLNKEKNVNMKQSCMI